MNKENLTIRESHQRSFVKSLIYRIFSITGTVLLGWIITKDTKETALITIVFQTYLIILYWIHERVWNKIDWGKRIE
jgi:uncharacterized membrane protein